MHIYKKDFRYMNKPVNITIFGSSQPKAGSPRYEEAITVGRAIAQAGWTVVSGGYRGTMEAVSRGAREAGGHTIGVTTAHFNPKGLKANQYVLEEIQMQSYAERLLKLTEMSDGYVVLRGGSGTLNELFHVWELVKNGSLPNRPIVLFGDHWNRIITRLAEELSDELSFSSFLHLLHITSDTDEMVEILRCGLKQR